MIEEQERLNNALEAFNDVIDIVAAYVGEGTHAHERLMAIDYLISELEDF